MLGQQGGLKAACQHFKERMRNIGCTSHIQPCARKAFRSFDRVKHERAVQGSGFISGKRRTQACLYFPGDRGLRENNEGSAVGRRHRILA